MHRITRTLNRSTLVAVAVGLLGCESESRTVVPSAMRPSMMVGGGSGENGAYFDGQRYTWKFPSGTSNNQRELVFGCFRLGVDMIDNAEPRARLYALFLPGATMHSCPDGSDMHDHILSAVPGSPGYATQLELLEVWPGPNFAQSPPAMPIKSEAALFEARDNGSVVIFSDELALHAVVIGPVK